MELSLPKFTFPVWTRNKGGENFYDITAIGEWAHSGSKLTMAENHPILTPAMLFVAKLFSQAEFKIRNKRTGKLSTKHDVLKLLNKPNFYSTQPDFLESLLFTQLANGVGVLYIKRTLGILEPNSLYILNYELIKFPKSLKKGNFKNTIVSKKILNTKIKYDEHGENLSIKLKDLMFFYDLPNATSKNPFKASSRLDGLKQTLINTHDSLTAKNIILRTNGKELLSGNKEGFPLDPEEKQDAEALFNSKYGLSASRKRGLITKANVTWKSLHIALRDLGLDESVKVDGNIIYTALHIPKDIISLEAKKTTYNNFKESMVSYIQNEIQPTLNSFIAVIQQLIDDDNLELIGSYEHMPIMQFILIERYKGVEQQGTALITLRKAGLPDTVSLERCGFDKTLKLSPLRETQIDTNTQNNGQINEEKILEIINQYMN